jgi:hypothetical protein|tara:strand:+ start:88 stop:345 length:258 start_codon:yes stop_codon:yes gene_type:complete
MIDPWLQKRIDNIKPLFNKVRKEFKHIDLSTWGKMRKFLDDAIPLIRMKQDGLFTEHKDGSASFDKRVYAKYKKKYQKELNKKDE